MSIRVVFLALAICVAVVAGFKLSSGHRLPAGDRYAPTEDTAPASVATAEVPRLSRGDAPSPRIAARSGMRGGSFPGVARTRDGLPLEDDPFGPSSRAEQKWLDRNGFPNAQQWRAYTQASDEVLKQAAGSGDVVAQVQLESRRLMSGDQSAREALFSHVVDGSGYALVTLAAFLGGSRAHGDPAEAYALLQLAVMRGDFKAAMGRDVVVASPLDPITKLKAEARALQLYEQLVAMRRARYGARVPIVDPRPIGPNG